MTYAIRSKKDFKELSLSDREEVLNFIHDAIANKMLVSIQADVFSYDDNEEVYLYGLYHNDHDWVSNYYSSGGLWAYDEPSYLLEKFTSK